MANNTYNVLPSSAAPNALLSAQATPTASGNTTNLNTIFQDNLGDVYFVDVAGEAKKLSGASASTQIIATVQATPTATGNTTNLNTLFKNNNNETWFVDSDGDALLISTSATLLVNSAAQATPFATGNTSNLNSVITDSFGDVYVVGANGVSTRLYKAPRTGDVLGVTVYKGSQISSNVATNVLASTITWTLPSYTPKSNSSIIIIQFDGHVTIAGVGTDTFSSTIRMGTTSLSNKRQIFSGANTGGGTRSSTLLPHMASVGNSGTSAIFFTLRLERNAPTASDDNLSIDLNRTAIITEIKV